MQGNAGGWFRRWFRFGLSPEQEARFRSASLREDLAQARVAILAALAVGIAFAVNDYLFLKLSPLFYLISALRVVFVVVTVLLLAKMRRWADDRAYDRWEFAWAALVVVMLVVIAATRPHAFVTHAILSVLYVFITLLVIPNSFANQMVISVVIVLGESAVLLSDADANPQGAITALSCLLIATVVAMAAALRLHSSRRREFLAHEGERQARAEAERQVMELRATEEERERLVRELERATQRLEQERALLETIVQQMPAGLVVMDALGKVVLSNDKTRKTMGAAADSPEDLAERARVIGFRHLNGEPYRAQELPGARSLHRGEVITDEEMVITRGDGKEATLLSSSSPLRDERGDIKGSVVTFYERHHAQTHGTRPPAKPAAPLLHPGESLWQHLAGQR